MRSNQNENSIVWEDRRMLTDHDDDHGQDADDDNGQVDG